MGKARGSEEERKEERAERVGGKKQWKVGREKEGEERSQRRKEEEEQSLKLVLGQPWV